MGRSPLALENDAVGIMANAEAVDLPPIVAIGRTAAIAAGNQPSIGDCLGISAQVWSLLACEARSARIAHDEQQVAGVLRRYVFGHARAFGSRWRDFDIARI